MFEIKTENEVNRPVIDEFRAMSYRIFRLLPGAPMLVPVQSDELFDTYELNLFAAKPDRVAALAAEGWLADHIGDWKPDSAARAGRDDSAGGAILRPVNARASHTPDGFAL